MTTFSERHAVAMLCAFYAAVHGRTCKHPMELRQWVDGWTVCQGCFRIVLRGAR